jgi:phenylpropionate dioxygenase-like ring-hydroxylating dioxygenase large terminal subunit
MIAIGQVTGDHRLPLGWFPVAAEDELRESILTLSSFGREIVLWRDLDDHICAMDPYCPHLGAHLGDGALVGSRIRCAFHGWEFAGTGECMHVPFGRTPRNIRILTYPVVVKNRHIFIWYHPEFLDPMWDIPEVDLTSDSGVYTVVRERTFRATWRDLSENGVDRSHFVILHGTEPVELDVVEQGPIRIIARSTEIDTPGGRIPATFRSVEYGPGFSTVDVDLSFAHIPVSSLSLLFFVCPIDAQTIKQRTILQVTSGDESDRRSRIIARLLMRHLQSQLDQDLRIFARKAEDHRPNLSTYDGPIARHRKWAQQFFV